MDKRNGGGRRKGTLNMKTRLRIKERESTMAAIIDRGEMPALSKLQSAMTFAEKAVLMYRPTFKQELEPGEKFNQKRNKDGDHDKFGQWFDRWLRCITEMASYQAPKVRAVERPTDAPNLGAPEVLEFELRVFEGGKMIAAPVRRAPPEEDE